MDGQGANGRRALRDAALARLLNRVFGGAALIIAAVVCTIWAIGPRHVAGFAIRSAADLAGVGPIALQVTDAGWRRLSAEQISVGADKAVGAQRVTVNFGFFGLFGGVRAAEVTGLRVEEKLGGGQGGSIGVPALAVPFPITLKDTALRLIGPSEIYSAVAPGTVVLAKGGGTGTFDLAITPQGDAPGAFMLHRGTLDLSSAAVTLSLAPVGAEAGGKAHATVFMRVAQGTGTAADLTLGLRDVALPALGIAVKTLELTGPVTATAERLALSLGSCARVEGLALKRLVADTMPVCPAAEGTPALILKRGGAKADALTLDVSLRDARGRYLDSKGAPIISGSLPETTLKGTSDTALATWRGAVTAQGGDLRMGESLALKAITLTAEAAADQGRLTHLDAALTSAQLSDPRAKPIIMPLTLTGSSQTRDQQLVVTANAAGAGFPALLHGEGSYDLSNGAGDGKIALDPLNFDPAGLKPETISPALAGQVSDAKGRVAAEGTFSFGAQGLISQGSLQLDKLAARLPLARVEGLDGRIAFSSLWPLATATPQTLKVALLDAGLPLTDGQIRLSVDRSGDTRIHDARWNCFGGTVGLSSGVFSPFRSTQSLTFAVNGIDLAQLLVLANVKGLSGTGKLSGNIPVTLENGHQPVRGGLLQADAPGGTIIYKTGGLKTGSPTEPSAILYTALDNFQYDALTAEIAGDLAGILSFQVHLKGRNPDLYDGRRIELNVSTEGAFVDMLRKGLYGYHNAVKP